MNKLAWLGKAGLFGYANWIWIAGAALVLIASHTAAYFTGRDHGADAVEARLAAAQVEALEDALVAIEKADAKAGTRTAEFEAAQDILKQEIEDAKAADRNALDAIFGSVPETD